MHPLPLRKFSNYIEKNLGDISMDAAITPTQLRDLRKRLGLTAQQATDSVRVNYRTWKGYEAPYSASSHRNISESTLSHFCIRHELTDPPISDDGRLIYKD